MKNCVIVCDEGFLTPSHGFSKEYPNAWLMSEGQADRELANLEQALGMVDDQDPFMIIRDYGLESELILYVQEVDDHDL